MKDEENYRARSESLGKTANAINCQEKIFGHPKCCINKVYNTQELKKLAVSSESGLKKAIYNALISFGIMDYTPVIIKKIKKIDKQLCDLAEEKEKCTQYIRQIDEKINSLRESYALKENKFLEYQQEMEQNPDLKSDLGSHVQDIVQDMTKTEAELNKANKKKYYLCNIVQSINVIRQKYIWFKRSLGVEGLLKHNTRYSQTKNKN